MVIIGRIHNGMVDNRFFQSYEQLAKPTKRDGSPDWLPAVVERLHVDRARNEIVDMVLHPEKPRPPQYPNGIDPRYNEATHIFWMDDDMLFPPNALLRLLQHDEPIVGGFYVGRQPPHLPIAYRHVQGNQWVPITKFCAGLQEVDAIGAGCLLVKREVFERMGRPWFEFSDKMGEDMYFCQEAKKLGYRMLLDYDVQCRHLTTVDVGKEHFEMFQSQGFSFQEHDQDLRAMSETVVPYRPGKPDVQALLGGF